MFDVYPQVPLTFWWFLDPAMKSRPPPKIYPPWVHACSGYACQRSGCWKWRDGALFVFFWGGGRCRWITPLKIDMVGWKIAIWELGDTSSNVFFTLCHVGFRGWNCHRFWEHTGSTSNHLRWSTKAVRIMSDMWEGYYKVGREPTVANGVTWGAFYGFHWGYFSLLSRSYDSPHSKTIVFGPTLGSCHIPKVGTFLLGPFGPLRFLRKTLISREHMDRWRKSCLRVVGQSFHFLLFCFCVIFRWSDPFIGLRSLNQLDCFLDHYFFSGRNMFASLL